VETGAGNGHGQPTATGQAQQRVPLLAGRPGTVRSLGYDERWMQDWLAVDPTRLGLGDVAIIDQEQNQPSGGLLDLLALDRGSDTYYSIEVQLGEIDGSHSLRVPPMERGWPAPGQPFAAIAAAIECVRAAD
jgi:hypothetical protein